MNAPVVKLDAALAHQKNALRKLMHARRKAWTAEWLRDAGASLVARVLRLPAYRQAKTLAAYMATAHEPPTRPLLREACAHGIPVCVPRYDERLGRYVWAWWTPETPLRKGSHGVLEPETEPQDPRPAPDVVLVPVLAVDLEGRRLGHGGGHYDRLLAACPALRIALAFSPQIVPKVPADPWDIPMDSLVTEDRWYDFRATKQTITAPPGSTPRMGERSSS